jgi:hypothetical protein
MTTTVISADSHIMERRCCKFPSELVVTKMGACPNHPLSSVIGSATGVRTIAH